VKQISGWMWFILVIFMSTSHGFCDVFVPSTAMHASTIARVTIDGDEIRTELEIGLEDLHVFSDILPNTARANMGLAEIPLQLRVDRFLSQTWLFRSDSGTLAGQVVSVAPATRIIRDDVTGVPVSNQPSERPVVIRASLLHSLPSNIERFEIVPPLDERGRSAADIGIVVRHEGIPLNDFRFLAEPQTVLLDQHDPWYSKFESRIFKRHGKEPMAAFIAVEPYEIRKELILRLRDVAHVLNVPIPKVGNIDQKMRSALLEELASLLVEHVLVSVDGEPQAMKLDRIVFLSRNARNTEPLGEHVLVDVNSALIGVIYKMPMVRRPDQVVLTWDLFSNRVGSVPIIFIDEAAGPPWPATPDDPRVVWTNFLSESYEIQIEGVQVAPDEDGVFLQLVNSIFGEERAAPDQTKIVATLLTNAFLGQAMTNRQQLMNTLSKIATKNSMLDIEAELRNGLAVSIAGGGTARLDNVTDISLSSPTTARNGGFSTSASWSVRARAGHWGHLHKRKIVFSAHLEVVPENGIWKLDGLTVLSKQEIAE
jgi:hypothetical protein